MPYHAHNDECLCTVSGGSYGKYERIYGNMTEMKWCLAIFGYGVKRGYL